MDDPSVGFNVQAEDPRTAKQRVTALLNSFVSQTPFRRVYHPLHDKKWLECGVDDYNECDYGDDVPMSRGEFKRAMMQDTVAFIGNSVAFCMGCDIPIEDATGQRDYASDKITVNTLTIPFEVRSTRGVLTQGEVFRAIQSTVWLNHGWSNTIYFEGFTTVRDYRDTARDGRDDCPTLAEVARWGKRLEYLLGPRGALPIVQFSIKVTVTASDSYQVQNPLYYRFYYGRIHCTTDSDLSSVVPH